ncbi:uncharacterized protein LOC143851226 isoform X2 [Tasmannia lanceolata]|uniref:uncharacterized protein LOC143851226 isoform X2 n=1 Tax=Tasmannia lanceolata TaxID=3420 RepID=UPI00406447E9
MAYYLNMQSGTDLERHVSKFFHFRLANLVGTLLSLEKVQNDDERKFKDQETILEAYIPEWCYHGNQLDSGNSLFNGYVDAFLILIPPLMAPSLSRLSRSGSLLKILCYINDGEGVWQHTIFSMPSKLHFSFFLQFCNFCGHNKFVGTPLISPESEFKELWLLLALGNCPL